MTYQKRISEIAPRYQARQIEAFMRLQYGTLDHLSPSVFRREVAMACECIDTDPDMAERLTRSYGL